MNNNKRHYFKLSAISIALASISMPASSQQLEEVIVSAQQRVQNLQDVPISVSTISGERISDIGITDLEELTLYVPNVTINQGRATPNLFIRGVGSGTNAGFEQSVGMYIDGVYSGRGALANVPMTLDLQRVEILKGPQGILFGKNTIGGAINITTEKPTYDTEGYIEGYYSPEDGEQIVTGVISGGLTDNVAGRLAVRYSAQDGFYTNKLLDKEGPNRDDFFARGALLYDVSDDLTIDLKYEYGDFETTGLPAVILQSDQPTNSLGQEVFPIIDNDSAAFDINEFIKTNTEVFAATINWDLQFATFTSISAYSAYDQNRLQNSDLSAVAALTRASNEELQQYSQELRLVSPGGEKIDWLVGAYFEHSNLSVDRVNVDLDFALNGPLAVQPLITLPGAPLATTSFDQETNTYAAFAQMTYNLTNTLRVTGGIRYNNDEKELDKTAIGEVGVKFGNSIVQTRPRDGAIISDVRSHSFQGVELDQDEWTWSTNIQWDASDSSMVYASASTGFKSGGFDEAYTGAGETIRLSDRSDLLDGTPNGQTIEGNNSSVLLYEPETVMSYEIGAKMTLLDGAAELNIAVFRSDYENLQTSSLEGDAFVVGNAGESRIQGVEVDGRWALTDSLTLSGAVAYLDAEYEDFTGATCTIPQAEDPSNNPGCLDELGENITAGNQTGGQDLTGETLVFAPDVSSSISLEHVFSMSNGLELVSTIDVNYSDNFFSSLDLDPATEHDSNTQWNARIALNGNDDKWSVSIIGKNLSDEEIYFFKNDVALTNSNSYFGVPDRGRTIAIQGRYRF